MNNYKAIFQQIENSLKKESSLSELEFETNFKKYKNYKNRKLTDNEVYHILVMVTFYSGMKASTVKKKEEIIKNHFPNFESVSRYGESVVEKMMSDKQMIKNRRKIEACIYNAKTFKEIIEKYGSFQNYIDGFKAEKSFENLMLLKEELQWKFKYIGGITAYHFLTDLGYDVLKPDRVIQRIFKRLDLIEDPKQLLKSVIVGRKISKEAGQKIRYVDIILVKYGQEGDTASFGLENGICLETNPRCELCGVYKLCKFEHKKKMKHLK